MVPQVAYPSQDRSLVGGRSRLGEEILDEQSEDLALKQTDVNDRCDWSGGLCSFSRLALEDWLDGVRM